MTDTTKLIQELVGLAVEKGLNFQYVHKWSFLFVGGIEIDLDNQDTPAQLQAAIDKIKEL